MLIWHFLLQDATLERCFGNSTKIIDCNWEYVSGLRTLREPHEPMPRLKDLLEYVSQPEFDRIWVLLDIKVKKSFSTDSMMQN